MPRKAGKRKFTTPVDTGPSKKALVSKNASIVESSINSEAIKEDNVVVLVCGDGDVGQLGLGDDVLELSHPTAVSGLNGIVAVTAGAMHSILLTKSRNKLITFGCNDEGALGRESGAENVPGFVNMVSDVAFATAGDSHSAALLTDGSVYLWGVFRDSQGLLGLFKDGQMEKTPKKLELPFRTKKIASGSNHLVLLSESGRVYTMGCGEQGQLGRLTQRSSSRNRRGGVDVLLTPQPIIMPLREKVVFNDIWAGGYSTFVRSENGKVFVFGLNNYCQLGLPRNDDNSETCIYWPKSSLNLDRVSWKKIVSSEHHDALLDETGKVYTLGRKEYGRLGLGKDCNDADTPTVVPVLMTENCTDVTCGGTTTFAVTNQGDLYSWGMGSVQLGQGRNGEENDCFEPKKITGKTIAQYRPVSISAGSQHLLILAIPK